MLTKKALYAISRFVIVEHCLALSSKYYARGHTPSRFVIQSTIPRFVIQSVSVESRGFAADKAAHFFDRIITLTSRVRSLPAGFLRRFAPLNDKHGKEKSPAAHLK